MRAGFSSGLWITGQPFKKFYYTASVNTNLSQLGVTAANDPRGMAYSASVQWLPTTGEFGPRGGFGDLEHHTEVATRFGASVAHARDLIVLMDNTWATPLFFPPHARGVDIAIEAGTKYCSGSSDLLLGMVSANERCWRELRATFDTMAICAGPEDVFLALRGLRTMKVRLKHHQESALAIARWFASRPEVARVLHPALESDPGHAIWKRDFTGASGLFSIAFKPMPDKAAHAFINALTLFGIGASWGGFESLAIPFDCSAFRTATKWEPGGPTIRFHIGLEDVDDLTADLERGFAAMQAVA